MIGPIYLTIQTGCSTCEAVTRPPSAFLSHLQFNFMLMLERPTWQAMTRVNLQGKWIQNPQRCSASKVLAAATRGTQAQPPQSGPPSHQMFRLALGQVHLTISKFGRRHTHRERERRSHSLTHLSCIMQDTGSSTLALFRPWP